MSFKSLMQIKYKHIFIIGQFLFFTTLIISGLVTVISGISFLFEANSNFCPLPSYHILDTEVLKPQTTLKSQIIQIIAPIIMYFQFNSQDLIFHAPDYFSKNWLLQESLNVYYPNNSRIVINYVEDMTKFASKVYIHLLSSTTQLHVVRPLALTEFLNNCSDYIKVINCNTINDVIYSVDYSSLDNHWRTIAVIEELQKQVDVNVFITLNDASATHQLSENTLKKILKITGTKNNLLGIVFDFK